eukprot:6476778-Amphidinium_carterae.1
MSANLRSLQRRTRLANGLKGGPSTTTTLREVNCCRQFLSATGEWSKTCQVWPAAATGLMPIANSTCAKAYSTMKRLGCNTVGLALRSAQTCAKLIQRIFKVLRK